MLYDIAFFLFSILYLPALLMRGKLHREFAERFAIFGPRKRDALESARGGIWIQAVSVGEVALCKSLIPLLREELPERTIVFSTITKTGNELAKKLFSEDAVVIYFPLDFSFVARRAVDIIRPKLYVMVETEIWPNVLGALAARGVPSMVINGRISDRSYGKYRMARPFLVDTLETVRLFCMQSDEDAERIVRIGAPQERVKFTGTMKFDADISPRSDAVARMREIVGAGDGGDLLVAGSTHGGEEEVLLAAYGELLNAYPKLRLLVAPRHIERAAKVEEAARKAGFTAARISTAATLHGTCRDVQVVILDTIGQLGDAYALATVVFVGGSMIPHGGQNPIEPAIFEKPVVFGPHMFNFRTISAVLLANRGAVCVKDARELARTVRDLLRSPEERAKMGRRAREAIVNNRGATARNLEEMKRLAHA